MERVVGPCALLSGGERDRAILRVSPAASEQEIRNAYMKLLLVCHPDKNKGHARAGDAFREVTRAYKSLTHQA